MSYTHTGVAHKLHHPTISMSFLSDVGDIISTPSQQYVCESSVTIAEPSNVTTSVSGTYVRIVCSINVSYQGSQY